MLIPRLGQRRSEMTLEYLFVLEKKEVFRECWGTHNKEPVSAQGAGQAKSGRTEASQSAMVECIHRIKQNLGQISK